MDETNTERRPLVGVPTLPEVADIGQIAVMKLPFGFVIGKRNDPALVTNFFQEYHLEMDPTVKVYFEYRGRRMSQGSSDSFRMILAAPSHNLPQAELDMLAEVLQGKRKPADFRIFVAKTQDINDKRVIVIEGRYPKHELQTRTLYVDSDSSGSAVQEITFQAPSNRFNKYIVQGTKSLESIKWK